MHASLHITSSTIFFVVFLASFAIGREEEIHTVYFKQNSQRRFLLQKSFSCRDRILLFFVDLSLKIFLWIILNHSVGVSVFQCIWYLDGFKVILTPFCMQILKASFDAHTFLQKCFLAPDIRLFVAIVCEWWNPQIARRRRVGAISSQMTQNFLRERFSHIFKLLSLFKRAFTTLDHHFPQ